MKVDELPRGRWIRSRETDEWMWMIPNPHSSDGENYISVYREGENHNWTLCDVRVL